jgi:2-polyprenyl-3-methyl-5-hydroxy-6-metoxy-1,4-benzoquinol methylase
MTPSPPNTPLKGSSYWDARFQEQGFAYGEAPNDFLLSCTPQLTRGKALSLAEGEGRNAVYLAKMGFEVTAVDFSEVGLQKARALAHQHGVQIQCVCADLADFDMNSGRWDLVISIFSQPESAVRQRLYGQLTQSLNPGGAFILESKVEPSATAKDRYPGVDFLRKEIGQMRVIHALEGERVLNEGRYHQGSQRTAQIWAQRD